MDFPNKKYNIIYADPPWSFNSSIYQDGGRTFNKKIKDHYQTMSIDNIKNLPVKNITDKDCILFIWTTDSHLQEVLEVIKNWNFKFSQLPI